MKTLWSLVLLLALSWSASAQMLDPLEVVQWSVEIKPVAGQEYEVIFSSKIKENWSVYSQYLESDDGPVRTSINYETKGIEVIGKGKETGKRVEGFDEIFGMNVIKFKKTFTISQRVKISDISKEYSGYLEFMTCDDRSCLPPTAWDFSLKFPENKAAPASTEKAVEPKETEVPNEKVPEKEENTDSSGIGATEGQDSAAAVAGIEEPKEPTPLGAASQTGQIDWKIPLNEEGEYSPTVASIANTLESPVSNCTTEDSDESLLTIFLLGFVGGFIALLTPCVFPMIPLTVSFFTKRSETRTKGIKNALIYGLSIIGIYVAIGIIITATLGANALNLLSTHWIPNTLFFVLFTVFAFSFFGYFEITLPSSWTNKSDRAADRGGLIGIFFMAFTLSLVSFSCTGPIIGSLLVGAAQGSRLGPAIGMLGFSSALALPFALFAAFPSWLNSLPKSGGWMNTVKVVLGFVELALALKFLSVADMTEHWGILPYEVFVGLWILIALALAAYLFGLIRFPHDPPKRKIKPVPALLGVLFLATAIYFATGFQTYKTDMIVHKIEERVNDKGENVEILTGETEEITVTTYNYPSLLSGLAPPSGYSLFFPNESPPGLVSYKNYYQGLAVAQRENKPLLIDFTGYGCVNCRKMENNVWVEEEVHKLISENYILVSLYVDDRKKLEEPLVTPAGKKLRNVGNLWAAFEEYNFKEVTQPLYALVSPNDEVMLNKPVGYTPEIKAYTNFLSCGVEAFKAHQKEKEQ